MRGRATSDGEQPAALLQRQGEQRGTRRCHPRQVAGAAPRSVRVRALCGLLQLPSSAGCTLREHGE